MAKYHITQRGEPGVCRATPGNCPLAGDQEHYSTPEEARDAYEKKQESSFDSSFDVTQETEFVMDFTTVEKLKVGDEYAGSPISSIKIGRKNVTLDTEAKRNQVVPIGTSAVRYKEQKTARAREAQQKEDRQDYITVGVEKAIKDSKEEFEKAKAKFNESIEKYGEASSFDYTNLINAQATRKIWARVEKNAASNNISHREAAERIRDYYNENWAEYSLKNTGLSRSTSAISNAIEAAEDEAVIRFVRNFRWW